MAVQEITNTEVVQRCAKCDRENRIPLATIEAGVERAVHDAVPAAPEAAPAGEVKP